MSEDRPERKNGGSEEPVARAPVVIVDGESAPAAPTAPARRGFDVIFTGGVTVGLDVEAVKRALMTAFDLGRAEVEDLFSGQETVISIDVDRKTASEQAKAWEAHGAICRLEPHAGPRASRPSSLEAEETSSSGPVHVAATSAPPPKAAPTPPPKAAPTPPPEPKPARPSQVPPPEQKATRPSQVPPAAQGLPLNARIVTPKIGASDAMFSPIRCIRVNREERGLGILGPLGQEQRPVSDVLIVSVFEGTAGGQRKVQMLFFVKGLRRPYLVDASAINYASFAGIAGQGELNSLRGVIRLLTMINPRIMIDQVTAQFVEGWAPEKFAKDPILLATALGQFLHEGSGDAEKDSVILSVKRKT